MRNDGELLPPYTGKVLMKQHHTWPYRVSPVEKQRQLQVYTDALQWLSSAGLTAADVILRFHQRRVLPLMERKLMLWEMVPGANLEGTQMMTGALEDEYAIQRARRAVGQLPADLCAVVMMPDEGYIDFVSVD